MLVCANADCGREFTRRASQIHTDAPGCSLSCGVKAAIQRGRMPQTVAKTLGDRAQRHRVKSRARNLRHARTWDGIPDEEILERDGWRCQVPGCKRRPIRKDLAYPHPRSKSIDHIIPLSLGGDDTAVNKRAAHLACNIGRSNRAGDEQLALIGSLREPPLTPQVSGEGPQPRPRACECGESAAPGRRRCESCWKRRSDEAKKRASERYRAAHPRQAVPRTSKTCVECGEEFTPVSARQDTCGRTCSRRHKRRIDRERRWVDPVYRDRAIAATARFHERQRAAKTASPAQGALWAS